MGKSSPECLETRRTGSSKERRRREGGNTRNISPHLAFLQNTDSEIFLLIFGCHPENPLDWRPPCHNKTRVKQGKPSTWPEPGSQPAVPASSPVACF